MQLARFTSMTAGFGVILRFRALEPPYIIRHGLKKVMYCLVNRPEPEIMIYHFDDLK